MRKGTVEHRMTPVITSLIITFPAQCAHLGKVENSSLPHYPPFYSWVRNIWPINFHVVEEAESPITTLERVLIFITFPSLAQARLGELPALSSCTAYILVKDTQRRPQIHKAEL